MSQTLQMHAGEPPEALDRVVHAVQCLAGGLEPLVHRTLEDRDQQVVLAPEVQIHCAGRDTRLPRDIGDLRVEEPAAGEQLRGGFEDEVSLVTPVW